MTITRDAVADWLGGIAVGLIDLAVDNQAMASAAIGFLEVEVAPPTLPPGFVSPHFSLHELTYSATAVEFGIDNSPNDDELAELTKTAQLLEKIRTLLGNVPVVVSSGFRCEEVNALVGGATNSAHRWGGAADITVPAFGDPLSVCRALQSHVVALGIDQLIHESGGGCWVHVGRPEPGCGARGQCFSIANGASGDYPFPN